MTLKIDRIMKPMAINEHVEVFIWCTALLMSFFSKRRLPNFFLQNWRFARFDQVCTTSVQLATSEYLFSLKA